MKDHSVVLLLPSVSISQHFLFNYMHGACLGTMKRLVDAWMSSKKSEPYHIGDRVLDINKRLAQIAPPSAMRRFTKDVSQYKSTYKGECSDVAKNFVF